TFRSCAPPLVSGLDFATVGGFSTGVSGGSVSGGSESGVFGPGVPDGGGRMSGAGGGAGVGVAVPGLPGSPRGGLGSVPGAFGVGLVSFVFGSPPFGSEPVFGNSSGGSFGSGVGFGGSIGFESLSGFGHSKEPGLNSGAGAGAGVTGAGVGL